MYNFSGAASDMLRRVVYPPFVSLWASVRGLPGRRKRQQTADGGVRAAEKRRHLKSWNQSHGR